jgi:uncharacterized protein YndB with AHSA1/START domain
MIPPSDEPPSRSVLPRLLAALAFALTLALFVYGLLEAGPSGNVGSGAVTLTFLVFLPAALSAFVALVSDSNRDKGIGHYAMVPLILTAVVLAAGVVVLREGAICIAMAAPLWIVAGLVGSLGAYLVRKRFDDDRRLHSSAVLLFPLLAAQIESPDPGFEWKTVTRETVVQAPPQRVWPLLESIPAIRPGEGRWNVAQDVLGVPRPLEAVLIVSGGAQVRRARWGSGVRFDEEIVRIRPGRSIAWRFLFPDDSVRRRTDRHIAPDGAHLRVTEGAYSLRPMAGGRTLVRLETRYALRSPVNSYAAWWGELLLGGIQENVLGIIHDRVEAEGALRARSHVIVPPKGAGG